MKYIFVAGAPGSRWSTVVKNIYYSDSIDRSDYRDEWTYYFDPTGFPGAASLMHTGAYFDPGMACDLPEDFFSMDRSQLEAVFDRPFTNNSGKIRIIKSHIFSNHIDFLRTTFPECSIVLVYRSDDDCLGGWVKSGGFDIKYPDYRPYYKDIKTMNQLIKKQNLGIMQSWIKYTGQRPENNQELATALNIEMPPSDYFMEFGIDNIKVKVI